MRVFKYKPFNMHALHLLSRDELYLADVAQLNDPVDCTLVYKDQVLSLEATVCSLSELNDSVAMWSQYADGHRGICYELDCESISRVVQAENLQVTQRTLVTFDRVSYVDPETFKRKVCEAISKELPDGSLVTDYQKIFLVKTDIFSHEKEVRLATKSLDQRKTLPVPNVVTAVYMGLKMPSEDKQLMGAIVDILNESRGRKIQKFEAVTISESYEVSFSAE